MKLRHVSEAAWVGVGQVATAIGTIVGIRLLTQVVDPQTFGTVSLILGLAALAVGIGCTPVTQGALYLYPEIARRGETVSLRNSVYRAVARLAPWLLGVVALGAFAWTLIGHGDPVITALLIALIACDTWRQIHQSILNAARLHGRYGTWLALEAWGRPLAAAAAVLWIGESPAVVLGAYVTASLVLNLAFHRNPAWIAGPAGDPLPDLDRRLWRYALPLVPLGLIGWANGLSDRYIIGGLLSLADAGIYAAAYALGSRPMLIANSAVEQALRPVYQQAVSAGDTGRSRRILQLWLGTMVAIGVLFVATITMFHTQIAHLLLGEAFRSGSTLMPWIASGYVLLAISYVFERVCYAHGFTQRVLLIQSCTAVAAAIATTVGALHWGLAGAAAAVPVYFLVQLIAAILLARKTSRQLQLKAAMP